MRFLARPAIRPLLPLLLSAIMLAGCPSPGVRPPPPQPPAERPEPPPAEKPLVRPPLQVAYPSRIALLLPLSGNYEALGIAVRDGFLAAWFQQDPEQRPQVRIYDMAAQGGDNALLLALGEGAQFVVGPLLKDEVSAAAAVADGRVPVLALNFLSDETEAPAGFYQFALSPEDEARQAAQRAIADGHARGVALVPIGDWGNRILNAFNEELTQLGGEVIGRSAYATEESDHSPVIQQLLRLTDSRERHARLTARLGTRLEFQPRRRADIEFIFVAARPSQGRLIRPQLKFHYAGDIPMYTTSEVFDADPNANIDLDGVLFPHMPWVLASSAQAIDARRRVETAWPSRASHRGNLYAFGYDAWQLIPELIARLQDPARYRLSNDRIDGVTGRLSIDPQGRIHRELDWARIRNGQPQQY